MESMDLHQSILTWSRRAIIVWLAALALVVQFGAAEAASRKEVERQFAAWREALWPEAKAAGVSRATFDAAFRSVSLDWSLPDLVPPGQAASRDNKAVSQAEFGSPGRYFAPNGLNFLVKRGRAVAAQWRQELLAIERRYGVPHQILIAIWGRETAFGSVKIPHDAITALVTQAFMGRRTEFFRPQVIAALKLLEEGHASRAALRSSWAGAMGHIQMLPTHVLQHGVDFNGDGRRDIWTTVPDALATAANFLKQSGWRSGHGWGYEVVPPAKADCTREGPHQGRPYAEWAELGYKRTRGRAFLPAMLKETGHLLQPAGRHGPSFLVTGNFYVLKEYNESDLYALYVGHLADRLADNRGFETGWGEVPTYTRGAVKELQQTLLRHGYNVGDSVDGLIGFRTRVAVGHYQRKRGLAVDCWPGPKTMARARQEG